MHKGPGCVSSSLAIEKVGAGKSGVQGQVKLCNESEASGDRAFLQKEMYVNKSLQIHFISKELGGGVDFFFFFLFKHPLLTTSLLHCKDKHKLMYKIDLFVVLVWAEYEPTFYEPLNGF